MDVIDISDDIIARHAIRKTEEAVKLVRELQNGEGEHCFCKTCMHIAVNEANSWLIYLGKYLQKMQVILFVVNYYEGSFHIDIEYKYLEDL